ncbi:MAG: hypothetical protein EOP87_08880 [Verrucomicrobiaceae bacterium]|nr:MAG: hypothetical protein EOP87_08880 [Verrucomicrobiaceae bacterium]
MNTILGAFAFIWITSCVAEGNPDIIRGTYAHPKTFWDTGAKLDEYGVNAVFIHGKGIDEATLKRAKAEGCKVFAEFPTLNGKYGDYVKNHPDAHPIDDSGNPAPPATWFMGVCPTHKGFREFRMKELRELLGKYELDGIWMDYTHWHGQFEDPYPVLIKTCFNHSCLSEFEKWAGVEVIGNTPQEKAKWIFSNAARKWEDWRVHVIVDWAKEIRAITKEIRPNALVGIFHTAWKDEDLSGVRRRCLGLDFDALAEHVDVFSPMIYHGRSGKPPEYVEEFVAYLGAKPWLKGKADSYPQMWPIVQAHDDPRVSPEEFGKVLRYGLGGKSTGVMMFTIASVAKDPEKMEMMKAIYREAAK